MFRKMILIGLLIVLSGCGLRWGGGPEVDMQERGERICEDTNGEWVDHRCVYPAWQLVDTTTSVLGVPVDG